MTETTTIDERKCVWHDGDACPKHQTPMRKIYTFGSCMTHETEVAVFSGCKCAVSVGHDPIGINDAIVLRHDDYESAAGLATLRKDMARVKYGF